MANRYPYSQSQAPPVITTPSTTGFANVNMWQSQSSAQAVNNAQQLQFVEEQRQREYLKQQQRLRLMGATSNKQPVNADKLIENLLDSKDMFKPRTNHQPARSSVITNAQVSGQQAVPTVGPRPMRYSPGYSGVSTINLPGPVPSGTETFGLPKRSSQEKPGTRIQLPVWLSSQSSSLPPLYRHVWTLVGSERGLVDTSKVFPLLMTSGLPTDVLGYIWSLANQKIAGQLTEEELYIVLALVGLAQSGCTFSNLSILNLIPQAPIPNLNLGSYQVPAAGGELLGSSQGKAAPSKNCTGGVVDTIGTPPPASRSMPDPSEDVADDFSDFQSASFPEESKSRKEPSPPAPPQHAPRLDSLSPQDSPVHVKESLTLTPSVAFQGISHSPDVNKFQSIFNLGSSSRGIGSRLANHSLGAPKQSKTRHHKHHHHHHHHHHRIAPSTPQPSSQLVSPDTPEEPASQSSPTLITSQGEDEFTDFQQAKDPKPTKISSEDELFPKCSMKSPPPKSHVLKESAIRSDKPATSMLFESPVHMNVSPISRDKESNKTEPRITPKPASLDSSAAHKNSSNTVTSLAQSQELLSVEEDKYSALRALSIVEQEPTESKANVPDDFGDFLSADPVPTEDSFAALAVRDVKPQIGNTTPVWPSSNESPQNIEFQLDDWGAFESTPKANAPANSNDNDLTNPVPADLTVSPLVSTFEGLELETSGVDISWDSLSGGTKEEVKDIKSVTNTLFPDVGTTPSNIGIEQNDDFTPSQSTDKENVHQADNGSFVIKTEEDGEDDDFGEFIGPETWPEDSKFATKEENHTGFESQNVLRVKDAMCDTQSVSSLELPVLSRHGSLPSLDLKIYPSGSDKAGLLQSWDSSPQGIDLQIKEWCRCMQSCLQLLQAALATFTSISSESVLDEVVTAHEGKEYLLNLLEVYGICRRVKQSSAGIPSDSKLDSILAEVDMVWSSMELYFAKAELKIVDTNFVCNPSESTQEHSACGICLNRVGNESNQENLKNTYPLEYGGHVYHAACANLWVNCVDCRLPALTMASSLL